MPARVHTVVKVKGRSTTKKIPKLLQRLHFTEGIINNIMKNFIVMKTIVCKKNIVKNMDAFYLVCRLLNPAVA